MSHYWSKFNLPLGFKINLMAIKMHKLILILSLSLGSMNLYSAEQSVVKNQITLSLDEVASNIRKYKQENPNATDEQLNVFARSLLKKGFIQNKKIESSTSRIDTYSGLDDYLYGYLNSQEQALFDANPAKGLLCMANGKMALEISQQRYQNSVLHNGNGDAFRHILWTFGMAIDVGTTFALQWSNAHEYGSTNQPPLELTMDLYNNSVGLTLAAQYPNTALPTTFANLAQSKVRQGSARIIKNNRLAWSNSEGEIWKVIY